MVADNAGTLKETTTTPIPQLAVCEAESIRTPTLKVWGELSAPWDSRISEMLPRSIPDSEAASIIGAGHFCLMEKPGEVNEQIKTFLIKRA